jgi:hypothetical protein
MFKADQTLERQRQNSAFSHVYSKQFFWRMPPRIKLPVSRGDDKYNSAPFYGFNSTSFYVFNGKALVTRKVRSGAWHNGTACRGLAVQSRLKAPVRVSALSSSNCWSPGPGPTHKPCGGRQDPRRRRLLVFGAVQAHLADFRGLEPRKSMQQAAAPPQA